MTNAVNPSNTIEAGPPRLGLVVPPAAGTVPVDGALIYGSRYRFSARGLGLPEISTRGYDQVIDAVVERALALAREDAVRSVSLMGTSLSFYRGARFTEELRAAMSRATGLPCTTMSHAIVDGLRALGVRKVAVATAYIDEVNLRLARYLEDTGFTPLKVEGLAITGVEAVGQVPTRTLVALGRRVLEASPGADGILISCGGLITLDAVRELERVAGLPVVSSSPAGFRDLVHCAGLDARASGCGRLFE